MEAENIKNPIKKEEKPTGKENIFLFIVTKSVNFFHVMRRRIRKILIAFFAIVHCMLLGVNVEEIISTQKME